MADAIDRVGLGVDLLGGPQTLSELRAIRTEMEAIAYLGGRSSVGAASASAGRTTGVTAETRTIEQSVEIEARTINQRMELKRLAIARAEVLRREDLANELRYQAAMMRARQFQNFPGGTTIAAQRGYLTMGQQGGAAIAAQAQEQQRIAAFYRNFPYSPTIAQQRVYELTGQQGGAAIRAAQEAEILNTRAALYSNFPQTSAQTRIIPGTDFQSSARLRAVDPVVIQQTAQRVVTQQVAGAVDNEMEALRAANGRTFGGGTITNLSTTQSLERLKAGQSVTSGSASDTEKYRAFVMAGGGKGKSFKQLDAESIFGTGPVPGGKGPGGGGGPNELEGPGGGGGGSGSGGGAGSAAFRITRNLLLYEGITLLTRGVVRYTAAALESAKAVTEQGNALKYATEAAGGNLEANRALATGLQQYGYNQAQAMQVVSTAARATFRHPDQTAALAQEVTNIAAYRGGGLTQAPRIIEDIIGGRDRVYREYFNMTTESIYKQAGLKYVRGLTNTDGLRTIGKQDKEDYETEAQKVSKYVAALTEEEKEQLRLNYVLTQAYRFEGDAADRAVTLAGKMDLVSAAFFNTSATIGAFIADVPVVKSALDTLSSAASTPGGLFAPPRLQQSGPQNTITEEDIRSFGKASVTGPRRRALEAVDYYLKYGNVPGLAISAVKDTTSLTLRAFGVESSGIPQREYDQIVAENTARAQQQRQLTVLRKDDKLGYKGLTEGSGAVGQFYTYEELTAKGLSAGDILRNYVEGLRPVLKDGEKILVDYRTQYEDLILTINKAKVGDLIEGTTVTKTGTGRSQFGAYSTLQEAQLGLEGKAITDYMAGFKPKGYDEQVKRDEDARLAKEERVREADKKKRDEELAKSSSALSKLRYARESSFQEVAGVADLITGGKDNPYTKVLADQVTLAERMEQQWGFLGKGADSYKEKMIELQKAALDDQILKLDYTQYTKSSGIRGQMQREADLRSGPGMGRKEQDYLDIQMAIVDKAVEIPKLWARAAEVLGITVNPLQQLTGRIVALQVATGMGATAMNPLGRIQGFNAGARQTTLPDGTVMTLDAGRQSDYTKYFASQQEIAMMSPEAMGQLQQKYADSALGIMGEFTPAQIRQAGLGGVYRGAINVKAQGLQQRIEDAQAKARFGTLQDQRLQEQLRADEAFRLANPGENAGIYADTLLLSRTEGINPKDLTYQQFKDRSAAQERQAKEVEKAKGQAKLAVDEGKTMQTEMLTAISAIRDAILGGDISMVVQVNNSTQADIDTKALQDANPGRNPKSAVATKSGANPHPNTDSKLRYKSINGMPVGY